MAWEVTHEDWLSLMCRTTTSWGAGIGGQGCWRPSNAVWDWLCIPTGPWTPDPMEITTVCVVWNYKDGLEEEDSPRKPRPAGKG